MAFEINPILLIIRFPVLNVHCKFMTMYLSNNVLFYFVLSCPVLFCFVMSCSYRNKH